MDKNLLISARIKALITQGMTTEQAIKQVLGLSIEDLMGQFWEKAQEKASK